MPLGEVIETAVVMTESMMAARSAPRWEPAKVQFRRPSAIPLRARWTALFAEDLKALTARPSEPVSTLAGPDDQPEASSK